MEEGEGYFGATFGVGKCVMVVGEGDAEESTDVREREAGADSARDSASGLFDGAEEGIVGVVHTVAAMGGTDAFLVEGFVVGNQRQVANHRFEAPPHFRERVGVFSVGFADSVDVESEMAEIVFRFGLHQFVESVNDNPIYNLNSPDCTNRGWVVVGGFYVYSYE